MSELSKDQLIVCLFNNVIYLSILDLLQNKQVWKQVFLLDLAELADQGGAGSLGRLGAPDFFPNTNSGKIYKGNIQK